jgi:SAM-dependent methyltransferase
MSYAKAIFSPQGFGKGRFFANALDIGCGNRKLPGATGIDLQTGDITHDLNVYPWPVDSRFLVVLANHYLEHADSVVDTMNEVWRVLLPGGRVVIQVPYFRNIDAYGDPTHKTFFTSRSLNFCIEGTEERKYAYTDRTFRKVGFWYGWPNENRIKKLLTKDGDFFDQWLSHLIPVPCLTWELEKV